ncbi:hypothetical protein [Methylopila sp. M107]|uniref:hypothetical protein n=1 Tax=Methylopila sp. M107 TaxID=1101190 RepID=UPI0012DD89D6|nr:hypothetical protein [Methylopila sp. M107]
MSRLWKRIVLTALVATSFSAQASAQDISFSEAELVKIGKSVAFHSVGSLSDGSAVVVTSPSSTRGKVRGFELSKIVNKQPVLLASFEAKPLSISAKYFSLREAKIQVDGNDNIIVIYNVATYGNKNDADTGAELQIAAFTAKGVLKYSKLLSKTKVESYIEDIGASILPSGNILSVYSLKTSKKADVFMVEFAPNGDVIKSQQVSDAADPQRKNDGGLTFNVLRSGNSLAIGSSGQYRIIWSHEKAFKNGSFSVSVAVATYGRSGKRKNVVYIKGKKNSYNTSLSTFFREGGGSTDVVMTGSLGSAEVKFYREFETGDRELVRRRLAGSQEGVWHGMVQFKDQYAIYTTQHSSFNCYLSYTNISNGDAVGAVRLNNGRLANKCNGGTSIKMADGSIGSLISVSDDNIGTYFLRHKSD